MTGELPSDILAQWSFRYVSVLERAVWYFAYSSYIWCSANFSTYLAGMWSTIFATGTMKWLPVYWIGSSSGKSSSKLFDCMGRFKCTTRSSHGFILAGDILRRFYFLFFRLTKQFSNAIGTVVSALLCTTTLWMCSGLLYILVVSMSPSKANFLKSWINLIWMSLQKFPNFSMASSWINLTPCLQRSSSCSPSARTFSATTAIRSINDSIRSILSSIKATGTNTPRRCKSLCWCFGQLCKNRFNCRDSQICSSINRFSKR